MKSIEWLALSPAKVVRVLLVSFILIAFGTACTEEAIVSSEAKGGNGNNKALKEAASENSNSQTKENSFDIQVTTDGTTWTYVITKTGKNALSHFILNLDNCDWSKLLTPEMIESATVNGLPADLATTAGNGTGCDVESISTNIIKFDNLADVDVHTIVFTLKQQFHNYQLTTVWLKAGNTCFTQEVHGPCCPA
jgi:hypothetical protein